MPSFQTYNLPTQFRGDTFHAVSFQISINSAPAVLAGVAAKIEFRSISKTGHIELTLSNGLGLTVTGDTVTIDQFNPTLPAGTYYWDLQLTWPDTRVTTYVGGTWTLNQDVTE